MRWPTGWGLPSAIQKVKTNGVLTPLLWIGGLSYLTTAALAYIESDIRWLFGALSVIITLFIFRSFDYFREKNPHLIQSEEFQLKLAKQQQVSASLVAKRAHIIDAPISANKYLELTKSEEKQDV